jgi:TPR repeat protein
MKRTIIFITTLLFAQNLYFSAYQDIQTAKRIIDTNPQKAQRLFIEASSYLKQIVNTSINKNKPSPQAFALLGELYLKGWGVEKNFKKATLLLCTAASLGNFKAKNLIEKYQIKCPKTINIKEIQQ